ncbi:hypothetical protein AX769_22160 (plasmid) [Frondihabitans sp. PAMC 28766]|uniref:hypothetical protein n=1 Tax=Frondihabitans sp. PAMC 28766 TaxID=1795630 RepID=UPI00078B27A6|nr:hypothetical protein [Frondihabitans sp. PAMC 28766]AMM22837.1 hypothetical protein AX769_22160 [Frondihabitans sp. PAMC 28766]
MPRLLPLHDKDGSPGDSRLWINPDHIVTAAPSITRSADTHGDVFTVWVELKLEGVPMMRVWLGTASTAEAASAVWDTFLIQIADA